MIRLFPIYMLFPLIIVTLFLLASIVEACQGSWLKGLFYLFSGLINLVVIFM